MNSFRAKFPLKLTLWVKWNTLIGIEDKPRNFVSTLNKMRFPRYGHGVAFIYALIPKTLDELISQSLFARDTTREPKQYHPAVQRVPENSKFLRYFCGQERYPPFYLITFGTYQHIVGLLFQSPRPGPRALFPSYWPSSTFKHEIPGWSVHADSKQNPW